METGPDPDRVLVQIEDLVPVPDPASIRLNGPDRVSARAFGFRF